jgi:hypothetical protein
MKKRILSISEYIAEDARIVKEFDNLVDLALLESESTNEYREKYRTILFENFNTTDLEDLSFEQQRHFLKLVKENLEIEDLDLNETLNESVLKEEYQKYFRELLADAGVKSVNELDKEKKSEFFKKVREGWEKGVGRKQKVSESVINEAEIKSDEEFKKWAEEKLKKMHGDKYDEAKGKEVIDGLLKKKADDKLDYGAIIGMLNK